MEILICKAGESHSRLPKGSLMFPYLALRNQSWTGSSALPHSHIKPGQIAPAPPSLFKRQVTQWQPNGLLRRCVPTGTVKAGQAGARTYPTISDQKVIFSCSYTRRNSY